MTGTFLHDVFAEQIAKLIAQRYCDTPIDEEEAISRTREWITLHSSEYFDSIGVIAIEYIAETYFKMKEM
jgi:hypothetical protein